MDNIDVLRNDYEIDLYSDESVTINADVTWKSGSYGRIYLLQNSTEVNFTDYSLTTVLSDNFDVSETIYIAAIDDDGEYTKKELKFTVSSSKYSDLLSGFKLSAGDGIDITIPDSVPFLSGGKVGVDIPVSSLPLTIAVDGDKLYGTIGIDVRKHTESKGYGNSDKKSDKDEVKYAFDNIKDDWEEFEKGLKDFKDIKKKYEDAISGASGKFGYEADFTIIGFIEGTIDSEMNIALNSAGLIINPSIKKTINGQVSFGPVPVYYEAYFKAELEATLNLYLNENAQAFTPEGLMEITITLGGGAGFGISKLIGVGGGIEGSLLPYYYMYFGKDDYFKLTAKIGAYFKVFAAFLSYEKKWSTQEYTLIDTNSVSLSAADLYSAEAEDFYNIENYDFVSREYAENPSVFAANSAVSLFGSSSETGVREFKLNTYSDPTPKLIEFSDGTLLAAWIDDDTARSDINRTCVYYSYYNGSAWSSPAAVENDGTADFWIDLKLIDDTAYIVWVDSAEEFSDDSDKETMWQYLDISSAEFSKETASFGDAKTVVSNSSFDFMPVIFGDSEGVYAAWIQSSENTLFSENACYSVLYSELTGEGWGSPAVLNSGLYMPDSISAETLSGAPYIAYSVNTDGDLSSPESNEVYLNAQALTSDSVTDTNVVLKNGILYWYCDGNMAAYDISGGTLSDCLVQGLATDRFDIITDYDGDRMAVVYEKYTGVYSELYCIYYDETSGVWSGENRLTDLGAAVSGFSGFINSDNDFEFILNRLQIESADSDSPYSQADLCLYNLEKKTNLSLDYVYFDNEMLISGNTVDFDAEVTNSGELPVDSYSLTLTDVNGTQLGTYDSQQVIMPGETQEVTLQCYIDDDFTPGTAAASLVLSDDSDTSDNSLELSLNYNNISVENMSYGFLDSGTVQITANIVNRGYGSGENISVSLIKDSLDGEIVETKEITVDQLLETGDACFETEAENGDVFYIYADVEDMLSGDNYDSVTVESSTYEFTDGGIIITNGGSYTEREIVIPSEIDGYTVVGIGSGAYDGCDLAESITIPDTVTSIDEGAFTDCLSLTEITIPANVSYIGENVFEGCMALENIYVDSGNEYYYDKDGILFAYGDDGGELVRYPLAKKGDYTVDSSVRCIHERAFKGCVYLTSIQISELNGELECDYAFSGCTNLETVTIADGIETIGEGMFMNCSSLKTIDLPDSVTAVESYAFKNCASLAEMTLGDNVLTIGKGAFSGCSGLNTLSVPFVGETSTTNTYLGYIFGGDSYSNNASYVPSSLENIKVTGALYTLASNALYGCTMVKNAEINNMVVSNNAFRYCTSLEGVTFTHRVLSITTPFGNCGTEFTIYGYDLSAAYTYANNNSYTFESLGEIPEEIFKTGTCGYDISWTLYYDNTLVLDGTGSMPNLANSEYGWYAYRSYIKHVEIKEGINSIGTYAFSTHTALVSAEISDTVKSIGNYAFNGCTSLNNAVIPDSVTGLGNYAFAGCTSLSDITLGSGLTSLGTYVFSGDTALIEISLPEGITSVPNYAFNSCTKLEEISFAGEVTTIGNYAFYNCSALKTILMGYTVKSIGTKAFSGHSSDFVMKGYSGSYAESYASSESITFEAVGEAIPEDVYVSETADDGSSWELSYDGKLTVRGSGKMTSYSSASGCPWYSYSNLIKEIYVDGPTTIGTNAFSGCTRAVKAVIGDGVLTVGNYAFYGCTSLEEVTFADTVTEIGQYAFQNCTSLKTIELPEGLTTIGNYGFYNTGLVDAEMNDSLKTIGNYAFGGCSSLNSILISYKTVSIGKESFNGRSDEFKIIGYTGSYAEDYAALYSITFEALDGEIPDEVCAEGTLGDAEWSLDYDGTLTIRGYGDMTSYSGASGYPWYTYINVIKTVVIEEGITSVGAYAFNSYTYLKSISLPDGIKTINSYAFNKCTALTSVNLPDSLTTINSYGFYGCTSLNEITGGSGLQTIAAYAFGGCSSLCELTLSYTLMSIEQNAFSGNDSTFTVKGYSGSYAEDYCTTYSIPFEVLDGDITGSARAEGDLGDDFTWTLTYSGDLYINGAGSMPTYTSGSSYGWYTYRNLIKNVYIADGITTIGAYAFYNEANLTGVYIPDGVKTINSYAFYGCSSLAEITLPENVKTLSSYAFSGCTALAQVNITGTALQTIAEYAFANCTSLKEITLHYSVVKMYSTTFNNRSSEFVIKGYTNSYAESYAGLYSIDFEALDGETPSEAYISGTSGNISWAVSYDGTLTISGIGTMSSYSSSSAEPWYSCRDNIRRIIVETGVTSIGNYAFSDLIYASEATMADTVKSIGNYAFRNDTSLTAVSLSDNITTMGTNVFNGCTSLESIVLPGSLTTINSSMFYGCTSLTEVEIPVSVKTISDQAFRGCTAIDSIKLLYSVVSIATNSFYGHNENFTILGYTGSYAETFAEANSIPFTAIDSDESLSDLEYASGTVDSDISWRLMYDGTLYIEGVGAMPDNSSYGWQSYSSYITSAVVESGITSIGTYTFSGLTKMKTVELPQTILTIGSYAFRSCQSLESIDIPESVSVINAYCFNGCTALTDVVLSENVTTINNYAFSSCSGLTGITIPYGVLTISSNAFNSHSEDLVIRGYTGSYAEEYADSRSITFESIGDVSTDILYSGTFGVDMQWELTYSGELILYGTGTMIDSSSYPWSTYASKVKKLTVTEGISNLGNYTCQNMTNLTEVSLADSVKSIGSYAFYGCTGLTEINLNSSIASLDSYAFYNCTGLKNIDLTYITSIGSYTFYNCTALTSVSLNDNITSLGSYAFYNCTVLTELYIGKGITSIPSYAFYNCKSLESLNIGENVTTINTYAFQNCTGLKYVSVPETVTYVYARAFRYCSAIEYVFYGGSEAQWNKITFESYNTALTEAANIIYNKNSLSYYVESTSQSDSDFTAVVIGVSEKAGDRIILAAFDEYGRLADTDGYTVKNDGSGGCQLSVSLSEGQTARLYIWNSELKPYSDVLEHSYENTEG
ncbi:MAG: leucine-rich repeat domain-containing protein [Clostridiales bacterium]|nr:leucine-rich repeat domain-containing protein [Clostridiales bacterium]